jgi:pilus assembly protein CpaC
MARLAAAGFLLAVQTLCFVSPAAAQQSAEPQPEPAPPALNGFAETWRSSTAAKEKKNNRKAVRDDLGRIQEIEMFVGETRIFSVPDVARIAVGNGQIMSAASLDDKEVIVFANATGTSSLFIWNRDGRYRRVKINIVPGDTSRYAREIAAFLSSIPKARAAVIGDKVVVEGDELDDQDLAKIDELAKRYPQIVNFTNPVGWDQMVLMDVKVVEFPKNELKELGLKWQAMGGAAVAGVWSPISYGKSNGEYQINLMTGSGNPAPIVGASSSGAGTVPLHSGLNLLSLLNMGLNAQLNLLAEDGKAAILASPQLSARNGATAEFLAGGELPYTVSSINGTTVQFKPYGIKLQITPRVAKNGVIRAKLNTEVSTVDSSISTPSGPALLTRNTKTEFNLHSGDTLVLSGLISRKNSEDIAKVPLLGDIPVLGALFRSTQFKNDETELVVFVTPTVVDSRSPALVDRIDKAKRRLGEQLGEAPHLSDPLQPAHDTAQPNQPVVPSAAPSPEPAAEAAEVSAAATPEVAVAPPAPAHVPAAAAITGATQIAAVTARPTNDPASGRAYRVTGSQLALRVSPDINAYVVERMPAGAEVRSLSERRQGSWLAVEYQGQWGWSATEYLAPQEGGD